MLSKPVLIGAGILIAILLVGGVYASQRAQINALRQEIARTVEVIEQSDKERALHEGQFTRTLENFTEVIKAIKTVGGGTVVIRETTRPVPAAQSPRPGQPTPPPTPPQTGKPLIPPEKVEDARTAASERILVELDPGHLLDCPAPGLGADELELIRDPSGRLLSPNTCVARINDEVRLKEPPAQAQARRRGRWKATAGYGFNAGVGYGVSYELLKVPIIPVTFDAVAIVSPSFNVGPGAAWRVNDAWSVGGAYLYGTSSSKWSPWVTISFRP